MLVNNDHFAHEMKESPRVGIGMSGRYKLAIAHVQVHLDVVLAPLLEVVGLQVVDDGQVVDVATAL